MQANSLHEKSCDTNKITREKREAGSSQDEDRRSKKWWHQADPVKRIVRLS